MGNEQSTKTTMYDSADIDAFKAAISATDKVELNRRIEEMRKRRKLNNNSISDQEPPLAERVRLGTTDEPLFLEDDDPTPYELDTVDSGNEMEVLREDGKGTVSPLATRKHAKTVEPHVSFAAFETAGAEGIKDVTVQRVASSKRSLIRSSTSDPVSDHLESRTPPQAENPLQAWSPRKERAQKQTPQNDLADQEGSERQRAISSIRPEEATASSQSAGLAPPMWYQALKRSKVRSKDPTGSNVDTSLSRLKGNIRDCKTANGVASLSANFDKVRDRLHILAFQSVTGQLLRNNLMLSHEDGLPQIFGHAHSIDWPFDIKADAKELYTKWCREDFETDIMRGIKTSSKKEKGGDSILPKYSKTLDWRYHGNGSLVNGQWWPIQLCTLRDGAHGSSQGGIAGSRGQGAYSVIVSGGMDPEGKPYPDEDHGEWLLYCGTDSKSGPSDNTAFLLENEKNGKPVRLLRSHNAKGDYAPKLGFRYDGLYLIKSAELIDPSRNRYQFRLERVSGQDPIRGGDGPESRPTAEEINAYKTHRIYLGRA